MKSTDIEPSRGKILISEPGLNDLYFNRSVVLLAEHNEFGSMGFVLNKPIDVKISEISSDFSNLKSKVYLGGPVETDKLFVIHSHAELIDDCFEIKGKLCWGGNIDKIKDLLTKEIIKEIDVKFYVGYAGWKPKQLEKELKEKSWIVADFPASFILSLKPEELWKKALLKLGNDYAIWANYPNNPLWN